MCRKKFGFALLVTVLALALAAPIGALGGPYPGPGCDVVGVPTAVAPVSAVILEIQNLVTVEKLAVESGPIGPKGDGIKRVTGVVLIDGPHTDDLHFSLAALHVDPGRGSYSANHL